MKPTPSIADLQVKELVSAIGSGRISPGAGAAGAVSLALASACASKAVAISLKHRPEETALQAALDSFTRIRRRALVCADNDAAAFEDFVKEKNAAATDRLIVSGENLLSLIESFETLLDAIEPCIHSRMAGDLAAARALAGAARSIEVGNEAQTKNERAARPR